MDSIRLDGRIALVTGAGGDIGIAIIRELAQRGASIVASDHDAGALAAAVRQLPSGTPHMIHVTDVTSEDDMRHLFKNAHAWVGRLDILFNNAGVEGPIAPLPDLNVAEFRRVMDINVTGVFLGMKYALPLMMAAGAGSIINTASTAGLRGSAQMPAYVASKHAVIGLTKAAAVEAASANVRVNCICPGSILGRMTRRIATGRKPDAPDKSVAEMAGRVPLGRQGSPEEIASLAAFLASDASSFVTGAACVADGGRTAL
jgi:NAD(P)-dependent dehydrogenase (short-subunit alcohol dehydrogenase family)